MTLLDFMYWRVTAAVAYSTFNLLPCVGVKLYLSFCIGNRMLRGIHRPRRRSGAMRRIRKSSHAEQLYNPYSVVIRTTLLISTFFGI